MPTLSPTEIDALLTESRDYLKANQQEKAHQLAIKATNLAGADPRTWIARAESSPSTEEQLMCLSRAYSLDPISSETQTQLHQAVRALLQQEPFLAYVHETPEFYQVRSGRELLINIPKNRNFETPFLKRGAGISRPAFYWLTLATLGLACGGVGALVLAPLAAFQALHLQSPQLIRSDRVRLWVAFALAVIVWLVSIPISFLLLIRLYS